MKAAFNTLLGVALILSVAFLATAEEKKAEGKVVTLKGELTCAKCSLKLPGIDKCTNAITVKDGDKEVVYLLDDKGGKEKYHKKICAATKPGSVKGVVSEKDGQKYIKPVDGGVKYDK